MACIEESAKELLCSCWGPEPQGCTCIATTNSAAPRAGVNPPPPPPATCRPRRGQLFSKPSPAEAQQRYAVLPPFLEAALMPFQREGVQFGLARGGKCMLADEMGVGKTVQAIALASCYHVGAGCGRWSEGVGKTVQAIALASCYLVGGLCRRQRGVCRAVGSTAAALRASWQLDSRGRSRQRHYPACCPQPTPQPAPLGCLVRQEEWPLLIVVPASLRLVWAEELEKWLPQVTLLLLRGLILDGCRAFELGTLDLCAKIGCRAGLTNCV